MSAQLDLLSVDGATVEDAFGALFAAFDSLFDRQPDECRFQSAGLDIACRGADAFVLGLVERGHVESRIADAPDLRVLHLCRDDVESALWPVWTARFFQERQIEAALLGSRYRFHYYDDLDFWQVFDARTMRGIQFARTSGAVPLWEAGSPLRNFIHWGLLTKQAALIHAGTLALNGRGVLLAGQGGSGKSGTVLAGLMSGLESVGDDYVALSTIGPLSAHPAFRTLKIDLDGARRAGLPPDLSAGKLPNWQGKYLLRLEQVARCEMPTRISVQALLLPKIAHAARTSFRPVSAKEGFLALAPSGVTQIPCARPEMVRVCAAVSRQLPGFEVQLGTQPEEIAEAIRDFIAKWTT